MAPKEKPIPCKTYAGLLEDLIDEDYEFTATQKEVALDLFAGKLTLRADGTYSYM